MNEEKETVQTVVDHFEIPEELAKELSDLLTKQTIREKILMQVINEPDKYEAAEKNLIPVVEKIKAIKIKITKEYVPAKYNSEKYIWNYNSWLVDKNKVEVITDKIVQYADFSEITKQLGKR